MFGDKLGRIEKNIDNLKDTIYRYLEAIYIRNKELVKENRRLKKLLSKYENCGEGSKYKGISGCK